MGALELGPHNIRVVTLKTGWIGESAALRLHHQRSLSLSKGQGRWFLDCTSEVVASALPFDKLRERNPSRPHRQHGYPPNPRPDGRSDPPPNPANGRPKPNCQRALPESAPAEQRQSIIDGLVEPTLLNRLATLDDVGNVTAFVASDLAGSITSTEVNISCGATVD